MALAAGEAVLTFGPSVYHGLTHEWDVMKKDPEKNPLKRIGHGFKAFGKGFMDSMSGKSDDRAPTSNESTRGANMTQQQQWG